MIQVKVYVYFGRHGIRDYTFLVNSCYESHVRRRGRKRVNIVQLFKRIRPKLRKINPNDKFLEPDKEYSFNVSDFNVSKEKRISEKEEKNL